MIRKYFLFTIVSLLPFIIHFIHPRLFEYPARWTINRGSISWHRIFKILKFKKFLIFKNSQIHRWLENAFRLRSCHFLPFTIYPRLFERSIEGIGTYFQIFNIQIRSRGKIVGFALSIFSIQRLVTIEGTKIEMKIEFIKKFQSVEYNFFGYLNI